MLRRLPRGPGGGVRPLAPIGLGALLLLALAPSAPARATAIPRLHVLAGDRSVVAEARLSTATGFAEDRDADGPPDLGPFAGQAVASAALPDASAAARAQQDSRLGPDVMEASGSAGAERAASADPAFVVSRGESYLDVVFRPQTVETLRLTATLEVAEEAGSDGFAWLEVREVGAPTPFRSEPLDAPGRRTLDLPVLFAVGSELRITALARADALGGPGAQSSFSVRVAPLPGPGAAALSLPALLGMLGLRSRGRPCGDASS